MLKVKSGDIQKLGLLYERYKKRLFGFFFQMTKDSMMSEDWCKVFCKDFKNTNIRIPKKSKFVVWLFQIARNAAYDSFKKNKANSDRDIDDVDYKVNSSDDIQESIMKQENIIALRLALDKLSPEKKELIVLSKLKELKYKEVGEIVGCSEGNARTKVHRAMQELKTVFKTLETR